MVSFIYLPSRMNDSVILWFFSYIGHKSQHNTKQNVPSVWDIINSHVVLNEEICNETAQKAKFMGPTWGPPGSCRPQMDPMLAPWTLLSGCTCSHNRNLSSSVLLAARSIIHASISCTKQIYNYSAALRYAVNQEMFYLKSFTKILNRNIFSVHDSYSKETGRILVKFDTFVGCKKLYRCQCDQIPLRPNISPKCFFLDLTFQHSHSYWNSARPHRVFMSESRMISLNITIGM